MLIGQTDHLFQARVRRSSLVGFKSCIVGIGVLLLSSIAMSYLPLEGSNASSAFKEILKTVKSFFADKAMPVRVAAAQCLAALASNSSIIQLTDVDGTLAAAIKGFEVPPASSSGSSTFNPLSRTPTTPPGVPLQSSLGSCLLLSSWKRTKSKVQLSCYVTQRLIKPRNTGRPALAKPSLQELLAYLTPAFLKPGQYERAVRIESKLLYCPMKSRA